MATEVANKHRGEVPINLAGGAYVLRPTWEAMDAIETQIGKSLSRLNMEYRENGITLHEASVIITECVKAHGREIKDAMATSFKLQKVKELVFENGIGHVLSPVLEVLYNMITGGTKPESLKKKESVTQAPTK